MPQRTRISVLFAGVTAFCVDDDVPVGRSESKFLATAASTAAAAVSARAGVIERRFSDEAECIVPDVPPGFWDDDYDDSGDVEQGSSGCWTPRRRFRSLASSSCLSPLPLRLRLLPLCLMGASMVRHRLFQFPKVARTKMRRKTAALRQFNNDKKNSNSNMLAVE